MNDFTVSEYSDLLKMAKDNYRFIAFSDEYEGKTILWRHDVDYSVHRAVKMAALEEELGIRATYFFQLGSSLYNLFEKEIKDLVCSICEMGHFIGLHFDPALYTIESRQNLSKFLNFEKQILESLVEKEVMSFSFHNPNDKSRLFRDDMYAGMCNAYSEKIASKYFYCSDSNGYWRFDRLRDVLSTNLHDKLHVLTHPVWWQDQYMSPRERIVRSAMGRANNMLSNYDKLLLNHQRLNIK